MGNGIIIGIGSTIGTLILVAMGALIARQWRTPKRVDRLERIIPPFIRAVLALLRVHDQEGTNGSIREAEEELQRVLSDGAISQKEKK